MDQCSQKCLGGLSKLVCQCFLITSEPRLVQFRTLNGLILLVELSGSSFHVVEEIPQLIDNGWFEVGITGADWVANWGIPLTSLYEIPCGRASNKPIRIVLAVAESSPYSSVCDLPVGCTIATEYMRLTQRYLAHRLRDDICLQQSFGNTEQKVSFGASAIVDVTETGISLRSNGLRVIEILFESAMVIVAHPTAYSNDLRRRNIKRLVNRIAIGATDYEAKDY